MLASGLEFFETLRQAAPLFRRVKEESMRTLNRTVRCLCILALISTTCGGSNSGPPSPETSLSSLAISPSNPSLAKGTMQQFTARGTFADNHVEDLTARVDWSLVDVAPAMGTASIDSAGMLSAKGVGQATISAKFSGQSSSTTLTVTAAPLLSVSVSPSNPSLAKGTMLQFTATGTFGDGSVQDLTNQVIWTSTEGAGGTVASILSSGFVTAKSIGTSTISATLQGKVGSTSLTVTAAELATLSISPSTPSMAKGTTQAFMALGTFTDGNSQDVTASVAWTATDVAPASNVLSINASGLATANNVGQSTLVASQNGKSTSTTVTVTAPTLVSISIAPGNPSLPRGATQQFTATGSFSDGSMQNLTSSAIWSATDVAPATNAASITAAGLATGNSVGQSTITVTQGGKSASTTLTVTTPALVSISITPANPSLPRTVTQQFTATGTYTDGSMQNLTSSAIWSATDVAPATNVASITAAGLATGNSVGQSTITATQGGKSASTTLTVTALTLVSISIAPLNPSLIRGTTQQFTATGTFSDGSTLNLTSSAIWSATDVAPATNVASITASGLATGNSVGQSTITATQGGKSGSTTLTVNPPTLVSISIAPLSPSLPRGMTQQFTATGTFSDGSTQNLTSSVAWSATDVAPATNVATITAAGLATGNNLGQSTITATQGGKSGSTTLTVIAPVLVSISITPANPSLPRGTTQQLTATGSFSDGSMQNLTSSANWSATDVAPASNVASITATGRATANNLGQSTITASHSGKSQSIPLTVTSPVIVSLAISPSNPSVVKGSTQSFVAIATLSDGSTQNVASGATWTAIDIAPATGVATINSSGVATGVEIGMATISATYMGQNASTTLNVIPICVPRTCGDIGAGCGLVGNGCGGVVDCGTCAPPMTCGGGGIPNQCGSGG